MDRIMRDLSEINKKYCAWEVDSIEEHENVVITVEEEDVKYEFSLYGYQLEGLPITDGKYIVPLELFNVRSTNEIDNKLIGRLGPSWFFKLRGELGKYYMKALSSIITKERQKHVVYPNQVDVFRALRETQFSNVKVVILGQDPYHNGLADGLCFSSNDPLVIPASLRNIFIEIENDTQKLYLEQDPDLIRWAHQGVLLLNTVLTVRKGEPNSHKGIGWENFTFKIISELYKVDRPIVWMLWGNHAKSLFEGVISDYGHNKRQLYLKAAHPSPYSVSGFHGCKHFTKCNDFLRANSLKEIVW